MMTKQPPVRKAAATASLLVAIWAGVSLLAQEFPPPPGTLVDIGGRRLHVHCTGAGKPTVILESGASRRLRME